MSMEGNLKENNQRSKTGSVHTTKKNYQNRELDCMLFLHSINIYWAFTRSSTVLSQGKQEWTTQFTQHTVVYTWLMSREEGRKDGRKEGNWSCRIKGQSSRKKEGCETFLFHILIKHQPYWNSFISTKRPVLISVYLHMQFTLSRTHFLPFFV